MAAKGQVSCNTAKASGTMFLDELGEGSVGPITVMVCRKWDVTSINGRYMSTDFIVSDKKGNVIHCTAKNNIAHCFIGKLHEGSLYSFKGFTVLPNKDEYRIIKDSPYMIELQGSTIVTKAHDEIDQFDRYPFALVDFEDLKPTDKRHFVDVIGYIASVGKPSTKSNGRQTLEFNLTNERGRHVRVTLWGSTGDEFLQRNKKCPGIHSVILTSMTAKYYLSQLGLSSSSSTLIIDSDDIPALRRFQSSLKDADPNTENEPIMQLQPPVTTLADLLGWAREKKNEVASFKGEIQITNVRTKNSWFHFTCTSGKCRKGVSRRNGNFWCESCDTGVAFPRPRFRLQLDIQDASASVVVVLFDEPAEQLTRTTAKAILAEQEANDNSDASALPHVLENLFQTKHIFEIRSNTYYHYGPFESFNCARVVVPDVAKQTFVADSGTTTHGMKDCITSSSKAVASGSHVITPAKKSESKKKRICIEDSDTESADENHNEAIIDASKGPPKTRRLRLTDSDDAALEDAQEVNEETRSA